MRQLILIAALLLATPPEAIAQKKCTKGIPCGNTCISADKVCHVGTTASTQPTSAMSSSKTASSDTALDRILKLGKTSGHRGESKTGVSSEAIDALAGLPAGDSTWPWASGRSGGVYYLNEPTCSYLQRVELAKRVYFRTSREAAVYGLHRSLNPGC